ncbi:MAG: Uma2 family endonuclease [Cyanobacteria bacterium SBLK]|nr:Uma2 family endonuclease [Cyanobacteria bacterium SBLK]
MVQTPSKSLTLEEFLKLPETQPASEYIDGKIVQKPMPQGRHSAIQTELAATINLKLRKKRIARAFSELRCSFGGRAIVPDISVYTWERIARREGGEIDNIFAIAPDWTIEILSPDKGQTKVIKNILHALKYDTQIGWLIDPKEKSVLIFYRDRPTAIFDELNSVLPVPEFAKEFELTVGDLFSLLL